jgi:predicted PurR-regulated permease PerM
MAEKHDFKNIIIGALLVGLFLLAVIIIRPLIIPIIFGILLAYILYPIYRLILSKIKNENISALIVCICLLIIIISITALILGSLISQSVNFYISLQEVDLTNVIEGMVPEFLSSSEVTNLLGNSIRTFIASFLADMINNFNELILNSITILLKLFVVFFIFFFSLRDGKKAIEYFRSFSPLKKETQEKFFKQFKDITYSVLVGQVVVGIFQGLIAGIGYFIFGVENVFLLTLLTMLVGIIPLIGPWLVWVPVDIYLFISGRSGAGLGLLVYGLLVISWLDAFIRPLIVSRKTQINSAIVIVGMIGGLFVFGILGLIIGPLVLAYVLLVIELYRKKTLKENIIFKEIE